MTTNTPKTSVIDDMIPESKVVQVMIAGFAVGMVAGIAYQIGGVVLLSKLFASVDTVAGIPFDIVAP